MSYRKKNHLSHIIVAKEYFQIDDQFAIIKIDDEPTLIEEAYKIADVCDEALTSSGSFDSIILIRRNSYNTENDMPADVYSDILDISTKLIFLNFHYLQHPYIFQEQFHLQ